MSAFRGGGGGWDGFGQYMRDKTHKLAEQFELRFEPQTDIFTGKTFWSTGRLVDFDLDLRQIITENGGRYEQYGLRSVSHIIASNLALSNQNWKKLLGGKFTSKSYAVVKPQWIVDSISVGRCLPEGDYIPECIKVRGTLEAFLNDTSRSESRAASESTAGVIDPSTFSKSRELGLVRINLDRPRTPVSVAEELCFELLEYPSKFSRKGYMSLTQFGSVTLIVLDLRRSSLSDAIISELEKRELTGASSLSLNLYLHEGDASPLAILPVSHEIHPSSVAAGITVLTEALLRSDEDSITGNVTRVIHEAGPSFYAVLLDAFSLLIERRRLDAGRDLLHAVLKSCIKAENEDALRWFESFHARAQEIFKSRNDGATLLFN
jgi:hypothetical protein